ncbi:hypothetical protein [Pseudochrobactrum sp. B5]|uniref:hypothetical protein n=1 Tax=Pseudochrobactrum sp. B5 TaxID=1289478 RepID=UPI0009F82483|nr:hypothetical protein [Pseudochrobactrum sp. B5]
MLDEISNFDRNVLEVIARGHPYRLIAVSKSNRELKVPAMTWNEIQITINMPLSDVSKSIATLSSSNLINSVSMLERLGFWQEIFRQNKTSTVYFWISDLGEKFLQETSNQLSNSKIDPLEEAVVLLKKLGYHTTQFGLAVALLSLESGYSPAETASHLARATLALDIKEAENDFDKTMALLAHAASMIDVLGGFKDANLMREEIFKQDATVLAKIAIPDKEQLTWIETILSEPVISGGRVATSQINY